MAQPNRWMNGYRAAMRARVPADFAEHLANEPEGLTEYGRAQWFEGWHSVWKCERKDEAEALIAAGLNVRTEGES